MPSCLCSLQKDTILLFSLLGHTWQNWDKRRTQKKPVITVEGYALGLARRFKSMLEFWTSEGLFYSSGRESDLVTWSWRSSIILHNSPTSSSNFATCLHLAFITSEFSQGPTLCLYNKSLMSESSALFSASSCAHCTHTTRVGGTKKLCCWPIVRFVAPFSTTRPECAHLLPQDLEAIPLERHCTAERTPMGLF